MSLLPLITDPLGAALPCLELCQLERAPSSASAQRATHLRPCAQPSAPPCTQQCSQAGRAGAPVLGRYCLAQNLWGQMLHNCFKGDLLPMPWTTGHLLGRGWGGCSALQPNYLCSEPVKTHATQDSPDSHRLKAVHVGFCHKLTEKPQVCVSTGFKAGNEPGSGLTTLLSP